ncbi:MAG: MOP flippase family protein [Bacteroidota bacterium]
MSLKSAAVSGAKWTTASSIAITLLQFLQVAILARLLSPSDFGLMGMIMVVLGFAQTYMDMGISNAIIHRQDTTRNQLSSLYWLNIFASVVIFAIILLISPLIVGFFREPKIASLLPWSALIFLITPIGQQFQILLQKELSFRVLTVIEVSSGVIGCVTAVSFALGGAGVFSLIAGQLANTAGRSFMLAAIGLKRWRPRLHFRTGDLQGYLKFGIYQMGDNSVNYLNSNLDKLLIGSLLGAQSLGYYSIAWNLAIQPVLRINPIVTRVAFPVFAKVQNNIDVLRKGYLNVLKVLSVINFPLLLGMAAIAPVLIPVVFGQKWLPAVGLLQILALVSLLRSIGNPVGSLLLAKGRPDLGFKWNLVLAVTQASGILIGVWIGAMKGVVIALFVLNICYLYPEYYILVWPLINCNFKEYLSSMAFAFSTSTVMTALILLLPFLLEIEAKAMLIGQIIIGALIYSSLTFLFNRSYLYEMKTTFFAKA